jgi:hypothetical protein
MEENKDLYKLLRIKRQYYQNRCRNQDDGMCDLTNTTTIPVYLLVESCESHPIRFKFRFYSTVNCSNYSQLKISSNNLEVI